MSQSMFIVFIVHKKTAEQVQFVTVDYIMYLLPLLPYCYITWDSGKVLKKS